MAVQIKIENYTKTIGRAQILDNVNMELEGGKIYGFKGKNGSGKTMLMRAICGLILPTFGRVLIDGEEIGKDRSFPKSVGALLENPAFLNGYTGFKNLKMIADIKGIIGDEEIKEILTRVGLDPEDKRTYKKYSLGMKQKLGIAAAVMEKSDIIILDEPINALDEESALIVRDILRELRDNGSLIILACHDTEELEFLSDKIYVLNDGKVMGSIKRG
ncbi:MAG: ATP-binding cassette domain-containing protein [Lachnospiraceae bacterium]|nr:ATP-binding cassette domain-containing protein [Lachnospiraceae bacterium]